MISEILESTSGSVSLLFLFSNSVLLIPCVLIVIAVLGRSSMRTGANLIVCQIAILDLAYAGWAVVWHGLKLANPSIVTRDMCSVDGIISFTFMLTWLYSATLCAYYRYYAVMHGAEVDPLKMIFLVGLQWTVPIVLTSVIASTDGFSLMPSGGYCLLPYHDRASTRALYVMLLASVMVPTIMSVYFYICITRQCIVIANLVHTRDTQQHEYYKTFESESKLPSSLISCHSVAYRAILHSSAFIFSFLPFGITMVYELISRHERTPDLDVVVIAAVLFHKVMSPIITLLINTAILKRVKQLIHLA